MGMKFDRKIPPRKFKVGNAERFEISDCGTMRLEADEQITFLTEASAEFDVVRKSWGYYATPSLNGRLTQFGLKAVMIKNQGTGRYFILLVERGHEQEFHEYCERENLAIVSWLDTDAALQKLERGANP
jgi:hypothetical protein